MGLKDTASLNGVRIFTNLAYWSLKSSFGVSTGLGDNARSGLHDASKLVIDVAKVGGESSDISWYALRDALNHPSRLHVNRGVRCT